MSAEEAGVPITAKDIRITKRGPSVTVDIEYSWPIDIRILSIRNQVSCL